MIASWLYLHQGSHRVLPALLSSLFRSDIIKYYITSLLSHSSVKLTLSLQTSQPTARSCKSCLQMLLHARLHATCSVLCRTAIYVTVSSSSVVFSGINAVRLFIAPAGQKDHNMKKSAVINIGYSIIISSYYQVFKTSHFLTT